MLVGPLLPAILGFGVGGAGIGFGGLIACGLGKKDDKILGIVLAVASGMIFALVALELLPESVAAGGQLVTFIGIVIGIILVFQVERVFHKVIIITGNPQRSLFIRSSILFALAIAVHNLPIGFATGAGLANQPQVGLDLAITMLFHNFPEGLAMSAPLVLANVNRQFIPVMASVVAVPAGLGAYLGFNLGIINSYIFALVLGIAMGTILLVTWREILGHARRYIVLSSLWVYLVVGIMLGKLFASVLI